MTTHVASADSEDETNVASSAYDAVQKQLRVTTSTNETEDGVEINLRVPKASGDDDEELHALLWGDTTGKDSDDEGEGKKRKAASSGCNRNRRARQDLPRSDEPSGSAAEGSGGDSLWGLSMQPVKSKKVQQESRELDKIEALVL